MASTDDALSNLIRQKRLLSTFGNGGLDEQPMPDSSSQTPALTIAVKHSLDDGPSIASQGSGPYDTSPSGDTVVPPPTSKHPLTDAYMRALENMPDYEEPSKGRKFAAALAGGLTGAFSGGEAGAKLGQQILNAPNEQALKRTGKDKILSDLEQANQKSDLADQTEQAKADEQSAEAGHYRALTNTLAPDFSTAEQAKIDEEKARLAVTEGKNREAQLQDGSNVMLHQDPSGGMRRVLDDGSLGEYVSMDAIKDIADPNRSLKQTKAERLPANLAASVKASQIVAEGVGGDNNYDQPTVEAAKQYKDKLAAGESPKSAWEAAQAAAISENGNKPLTSAQIVALDHKLQPEQRPSQQLVVGPDNKVIEARPGVTLPEGAQTMSGVNQSNTPTAATRGRGEAAQTAIAAGKDIQTFANANRDKLGNVGDYWTALVNGTPIADPTLSQLQGKVASWAAFQAAAHGFRASSVMREFEQRVGNGPKNIDAVISTIQGINDELEHAVDTGKGNKGTQPKATKQYNPATGKIEDIK